MNNNENMIKKSENVKDKRILTSFTIPKSTFERLRNYSNETRIPMSRVVEMAIELYFNKTTFDK